ncbi:hypothetical protein C5Y96_18750 [Blastopirellula marina]|uniref:Uncharacterized protein n=1 Tax=Blastopirellula marina TaxID=124 RepID=A0A2S8F5X5_9BACT|nr:MULTISPECIES: hypothetical protein [Pirellulaceae]PQO27568.1 hypothetical protein C5Y96_18750 [Blastopirellula marina]RCS48105.1 hypothetical protein DTL36_18775 [Bremerella cremea]
MSGFDDKKQLRSRGLRQTRPNESPTSPKQNGKAGNDASNKLNEAGVNVKKSLDAFLFRFVADPTTFHIPITINYGEKHYKHPIDGKDYTLKYANGIRDWRIHNKNIIVQALLQKKLWTDIWDDYSRQYLTYNASLNVSNKSAGKHTFTPGKKRSAKEVIKTQGGKALMRTQAGQQLKDAASEFINTFCSETVQLWDNGDMFLMVPVASVLFSGAILAGTVDLAQRTGNDTLAMLPQAVYDGAFSNVYHVGDFQIKNHGLEWQPSKGTWKVDWSLGTHWNLAKDLTLKSDVNLIASDATWRTKARVGGKGRLELTKKVDIPIFDSTSIYSEFLPQGEANIGIAGHSDFELLGNQMTFSAGLQSSVRTGERHLNFSLSIKTGGP